MNTISLPWPPKELSPNNRAHWTKKASHAKQMKQIAYTLTKQAKPIIEAQKPTLSIVFNPPSIARHDMDNCLARCKSLIDGISLAIGIDDSKFRYVLEMGEKTKGGEVLVTIC